MKLGTLLAGAGAGSLFTYLFDPDGGRRRRALIRDQLVSARCRADDALDATWRDVRNRAEGLLAEARALVTGNGDVSDAVLAERVRTTLGHYVSHPRAIDVSATGGCVRLAGPILSAEAAALLTAVRGVRGVHDIDDRLERHDQPGDVPALQGGVRRVGEVPELLQARWSPTMRLLVGTGGAAVLLAAARRSGLLLAGLASVAGGLLARSATPRRTRRGPHRAGRREEGATAAVPAPAAQAAWPGDSAGR